MTEAPKKAQAYLQRLCVEIPNRRTGSPGNREATTFFADITRSHGFAIATPVFDCMDWEQAGVSLKVGDEAFEAFASPYSAACRVDAALAAASTMALSPASPGIRGIMGSSCSTKSPPWRSRRINWRN